MYHHTDLVIEPKSSAKADEDVFFNCLEKHYTDYVYLTGQIAGQKDASITYHFNTKTKLLDSAVYEFSNVHDTLRPSLINKYGEPDSSFSSAWHVYLKPDAYNFLDYGAKWGCTVTYYNNDSWLLSQDSNSNILITGLSAKVYISGSSYIFTYIGYQHFTNEEIEKALSTFSNEMNNYVDQLNNDL